ncbi:MAG: type II secretion system protein [Planctomycetota bacterium]|jgi:prepilin-type N-terminal cleavage/methylation domain-containing protein
MKSRQNAFTLMEIMVVILIVAVLAGAAVPLMNGKINKSKWAEANNTAGMIRNAATAYYAETGVKLSGTMDDSDNMNAIGVHSGDLDGTYFQASDYNIDSVNDSGIPTITVTASKTNGPTGSKTLYPDGRFE